MAFFIVILKQAGNALYYLNIQITFKEHKMIDG